MPEEMSVEVQDIITAAIEKYQNTKNYEVSLLLLFSFAHNLTLHMLYFDWQAAAQAIKATMDKKYGTTWHCVIGEGMGFGITYQAQNMIFIYYGSVSIVTYKS